MKKMMNWVLAATLICGATLLTSCSSEDNPADSETGASGIAMIVKNGQIDYFRQIETAFRGICQEKGLEAYYYSTSAETAYQEQVAAVAELRNLSGTTLKGIIFAPSYGPNGESAEAEVAALAKERGIPVVILDSPVKATSPLASYPYFGTDNTAAGQAMAEKVTADKVAVFAMTNSPGIERAEAFKKLKPNAVIYEVGDKATEEVKAVLNEYNDFVFFNGNALVDALPTLKVPGKRIYTFDVYGEFLDELIAYSPYLKGVMAQNTFSMARKAVEAVLANATQGEMVPTFYITEDNLNDPAVKPFLEFYNKQAPAVIEDLAEKIIGKWMVADIEGQPAPTNEKEVITFVSPTKAYASRSIQPGKIDSEIVAPIPEDLPAAPGWNNYDEYDVTIEGNTVILTSEGPNGSKIITKYKIESISASEFACVVIREPGDGPGTPPDREQYGDMEKNNRQKQRFEKITADYSEAVLGLWECTELTGIETYNDANARLEFFADGTYKYWRKNTAGEWEAVTTREFQDYFVDGTLLATRWKNVGEEELREWWEIASIADGQMTWTALRANTDGSTAQQGMKWKRIATE